MIALLIIVGVLLLIASILDIKTRKIPSIFLTALLFLVAFLNPNNLWFGIMGFIIAFLLYESKFYEGIADVKIMTTLAFMVSTTKWFFVLIILTLLFGFAWKLFLKWRLKKETEIPFIPIFMFVYVALILLGGIVI